MLGDKEAIATIAVKDLKAAGKFYQETLGLKPVATGESGVKTYGSRLVLLRYQPGGGRARTS